MSPSHLEVRSFVELRRRTSGSTGSSRAGAGGYHGPGARGQAQTSSAGSPSRHVLVDLLQSIPEPPASPSSAGSNVMLPSGGRSSSTQSDDSRLHGLHRLLGPIPSPPQTPGRHHAPEVTSKWRPPSPAGPATPSWNTADLDALIREPSPSSAHSPERHPSTSGPADRKGNSPAAPASASRPGSSPPKGSPPARSSGSLYLPPSSSSSSELNLGGGGKAGASRPRRLYLAESSSSSDKHGAGGRAGPSHPVGRPQRSPSRAPSKAPVSLSSSGHLYEPSSSSSTRPAGPSVAPKKVHPSQNKGQLSGAGPSGTGDEASVDGLE